MVARPRHHLNPLDPPDKVDHDSISPHRRILLVEDEASVRTLLAEYLELEGFELMHASTGLEALQLATQQTPDLVILDVNLPGIDGFEVARHLRATSAIPILMLTGRSEEAAKFAGYEVGADDYVTKPFSPRELVLRVQALMRRLAATTAPGIVLDDVLRNGDLAIRLRTREVLREGVPLELTSREFDLLAFLASHPKQVFTRQQLLHHVWGYDLADLNTVTVHMSRLRAKVEREPANPSRLRTVWRVGYKFEP
jgi:DNA-binding response OmpR family regulator